MAAWLLRSGRLGSLKFESWGTLRCHPAAWFCNEARESTKPVKITKDPDKGGEDDRAALWTYKTTVAFPAKFSDPGILLPFSGVPKEPIHCNASSQIPAASVTASTKPVGAESVNVTCSTDPYQSKEIVSKILANEAPPVFLPVEEASVEASSKGSVPGKVPAPAMTMNDDAKAAMFTSMLGAEELSSSSSSDSDTDSECDPEDKMLVVETENRSFSLELQQPGRKRGENEELEVTGVTKGITNVEEDAFKAVVKPPRDNSQQSVFVIPTASKDATELTKSELSIDAAPITDAQYEFPAVVVSQSEIPEKARSNSHLKAVDVLTERGDDLGDPAEESCEKAADGPVKAETVAAKDVAAGHPAEVGPSANCAAELVDSSQVPVEDIGEGLHVETTAEQTEVSAAAPPEPEELFDNSTYKNFQHHSYTSYTFADLDVEMAKYRLTQPSSGKPSPRH